MLSEAQRDLENPQYLYKCQKVPIFIKPVILPINGKDIQGFCYYDLKRDQDERNLFYIRLHDVKQKLEDITMPPWRKPDDVLRKQAANYSNFFSWKVQGNQFAIEIRTNAVTQKINRMGKQIILSHGTVN